MNHNKSKCQLAMPRINKGRNRGVGVGEFGIMCTISQYHNVY
jgi:hypothetical protein